MLISLLVIVAGSWNVDCVIPDSSAVCRKRYSEITVGLAGWAHAPVEQNLLDLIHPARSEDETHPASGVLVKDMAHGVLAASIFSLHVPGIVSPFF